MQDLLREGGSRLGITPVEVVLEEDGTIIDDELMSHPEIGPWIEKTSGLMLLEANETWRESQNVTSPLEDHVVPSSLRAKLPNGGKSAPCDPRSPNNSDTSFDSLY